MKNRTKIPLAPFKSNCDIQYSPEIVLASARSKASLTNPLL